MLLVAGLGEQGLDPAPPQSLTGGAGGVSPIAKHVSGLVCGRPDPSHARSGVTYPCGNSGRFGASILKDMAQNRVTISDLAREAGVNKSAVSRALSGKPGVSEETRARVVELARKHGWRPNSTARALSRAESGAVGWVVRRTPKSSTIDPYFMDLLIGVQMELSSTPYNLVLRLADSLEDEMRIYQEWIADGRVDGVLLADLEIEDTRAAMLHERGIRCAAVASSGVAGSGRAAPDASVSALDAAGLNKIFEHLHRTGHRRIGWIAGPPAFAATQRRLEALETWRARFESIAVASTSLDPKEIAEGAVALCKEQELSAIVVDNELAAIGTVAGLRAQGLKIPEDVSVVSWLGSDLCLLSEPTITALDHDITGIGRLWTAALLDVTYGESRPQPPAVPDPVLRIRASTSG